MRAPHIHFEIEAQIDRKVTQLFFPNERLNGSRLRGVATLIRVGDAPMLVF
jgi:protocatechuate 3,4-dioxygenase beta subunit